MPFINEVLAHNRQQQELAGEVREMAVTRSRFAFDPAQIGTFLRQRIVGQEHVIASLCQQLQVIKAGLAPAGRPLLVMLMLGDTGVGKTELVRLLAQCIHGDANSFCRIDMNTLSQSHYSAAITGAPPGYVGSKENTTLINEEQILGSASRPGIVLFDEVEKASGEVARSLMNVFDNGRLRLASGTRELSFGNCLIFMTSNLGARSWQERQHSLWHRLQPAARRQRARQPHFEAALRQHFDPEFLNRIDRVELFANLSSGDMTQVVENEIAQLNQQLGKRQLQIEVSAEVVRLLAETGFDPRYGARSLRRCVRDQLLVPLAEALLYSGALGAQAQHQTTTFVLRQEGGRLSCQKAGS